MLNEGLKVCGAMQAEEASGGGDTNQSDRSSARSQSLTKPCAKDQAATHAYRKPTAKISSSVNRSG